MKIAEDTSGMPGAGFDIWDPNPFPGAINDCAAPFLLSIVNSSLFWRKFFIFRFSFHFIYQTKGLF